MSRARRASGRAVLLLLAIVLPLAGGEVAVRTLRLDGYAPPRIVLPDGRAPTDAEKGRFIAAAGADRGGSITQLAPDVVTRGWYDRPRWDYFDAEGCVEYRSNALGFRDDPFPLERPAGGLRVLALGDSFTFGLGVRAADTWVERLERRLAAAQAGPVEVINGGAAFGLQPPEYRVAAAQLAPRLDPDAILVGLCLNDVSTDIPMHVLRAPPPRPLLGGASRLLVVAQQAFGAIAASDAAPMKPLRAERFLASRAADWSALRTALTAIRDDCTAASRRLVVIVFPMLTDLANAYPYREIHAAVAGFCRDAGIECLDTLPPFLGRDEQALWVHPTDQHMNDVGHALLADALMEWFAARPLAPRPR